MVLLLLITPILSVKAEDNTRASTTIKKGETKVLQLENRFPKIERPLLRASSTEKRLENRENNIERIKDRIASTTASTSEKRVEKLNDRLKKQEEQMGKVKERLLEKELKVVEVLGNIASKIQERINILTGKSLDMTAAKAKLAEATAKIELITVEGDAIATLIKAEITEASSTKLFADIKTSQDKIRILAKEAHALLVDTIKEINEVLPQRENKATSTTSTTTN